MELIIFIMNILAILVVPLAIFIGGIYLMALINEATEEKFCRLKIPGMLLTLTITVISVNTAIGIAETLIK